MKHRSSVALLIETSNAYGRGVLAGITAYLREHDSWSVYLPEQGRGSSPPVWFKRWRGDGIVARIESEAIARAVMKTGLPVVDVSAARYAPSLPWVETDDEAIARVAAEHLLERGYRHIGFCSEPRFTWSQNRAKHFERMVQAAGGTCYLYEAKHTRGQPLPWAQENKALQAWVRRLPRPAGVFACFDIKAQQLLEACRALQVAVPEEIAVLGCDNDPVICNLTTPPLSSVVPNTHRTGYEAAALLDRLMNGTAASAEAKLISPLGIEVRQSTDALAIEDRQVASALRFIRQHACEGIGVSDVLAAVPLSRRVLESRFRKVIGRTPHEEILRFRLNRVKQLLNETVLSLELIADRTGFDHPEYLSVAFKRETGFTPGAYRRSMQGRRKL